jgi:hypothetical protein
MDLLFRFLCQNGRKFSNRARSREFARLTEREIDQIERLYAETLGAL